MKLTLTETDMAIVRHALIRIMKLTLDNAHRTDDPTPEHEAVADALHALAIMADAGIIVDDEPL